MDKIFVVTRSISYGDMGESYIISYHKSEEGAYLRMDKEAEENGLKKKEGAYDYWYSDDDNYESYSVSFKLLED